MCEIVGTRINRIAQGVTESLLLASDSLCSNLCRFLEEWLIARVFHSKIFHRKDLLKKDEDTHSAVHNFLIDLHQKYEDSIGAYFSLPKQSISNYK